MNTHIRRVVTALTAGAAGAALLVGCTAGGGGKSVDVDLGDGPAVAGEVKKGALDGVTLTFTSWGGNFQDAQVEAMKPFGEASGAKLLDDGPTEYSKIKAQVDSKNVTWDVVDTDIIWAEKQCGEDGLLEDIDTDLVDTSHIQDTGLIGDCYVPAMKYGDVLMYNADKYDTPPKSWADFFDTEKFPGKRAVYGAEDVGPGVFEAAALADGTDPDDLYPLDMDKIYKKLDSIRDDLVYWKTGAESQQMLESGEADMAIVWSGRGYGAAQNGANVKPVWNQALIVADALAVPKNANNTDASMGYINYYLGKTPQEVMSVGSSYSPVNDESKPDFDKLGLEYLVSQPEIADQMVITDQHWWAKNYDAELDRWMTWMQG